MTLNDLCVLKDLQLTFRPMGGGWYADFDHMVEIARDGILESVSGKGSSLNAAAMELAAQISGKRLRVARHDPFKGGFQPGEERFDCPRILGV